MLRETPSQTAGPYLHIGLLPAQGGVTYRPLGSSALTASPLGFTRQAPAGPPITIEGRVLDGLGSPCRDMLVELWQADPDGAYAGGAYAGAFRGWARTGTDFTTGLYRFETVKPGATQGAPFVSFWLASRGLNMGLHTRMYFPDEPRNATDPVLSRVDPARRPTLVARAEAGRLVFDIRLQGDNETVFFDV